MTSTPEGKVKARVRALFASFGADACVSMPIGTSYGASGVADFDIVFRGIPMKIETKATSKKKPTVLQAEYLRAAYNAGAVCAVVDADNIDEFESIIAKYGSATHDDMRAGLSTAIHSHQTLPRWKAVKVPVIKGV